MVKFEDGTGTGNLAGVDSTNRVLTRAVTETEIFNASNTSQEAYTITSIDAGPSAGEYILYIKNTDTTKDFHISHIEFAAADSDVLWKLHEVTGTASGSSALTPFNLNLGSGKTATMTARGDGAVAGLSTVAVFHTARNNDEIPFAGSLILGLNDAIAVEYDAGTGNGAEVIIEGFFQ